MPGSRRHGSSPLGQAAADARARRANGRAYARASARLAPAEALARVLLAYRLEHSLSQKQLAARLGTTHSVVSRLEGGQAAVTLALLRRVTHALGGGLLLGLELGGRGGGKLRESAQI